MEEPWDLELVSRLADGVLSFLSAFAEDWAANDMRVALFKILLGWLVLSLVAIHFAWKVYGSTVNDMYYRLGTGGQNGGTPDTAPHLSGWESMTGDGFKTHRE
ncbi:T-cell leukemia translocation-altered gene protein homolog isoform X1 [Scleropages formosus]|uniref:T-cell leukemia translocation-altered gene protein homolog n=2 Tax=Scleropages formosus TaxID=113540 RepID=A0A8C9W316_SCLFO|nr:T-cell leukemia translocation-altered gene protein isoform X1 [Scleropages formosus]